MKQPFFILSGPSGVGKTTALRGLTDSRHINFTIPQKVTTRSLKSSDDPRELCSVSLDKLNSLREDSGLMLEYERHGNKYALLKPDTQLKRDALVQAVPARLIKELREQYQSDYQFIVLRLFATADTILSRVEKRKDPISNSEKESRIRTIFTDLPENIDYYIDADRSPEDVALSIEQISQRYIRANKLGIFSDSEREILNKIQEVCFNSGIPCALFGGLSARIHGANRMPTDIDILVGSGGVNLLADHMKAYGPSEVKLDKIICGRIDIRMAPVRIGDRSIGQVWDIDQLAIERSKQFSIDGIDINIISPEDVYVMKAALQRGADRGKFDVEDACAILDANSSILDWKYIEERAARCNVASRVANFTKDVRKNAMKLRNNPTPL